MQEYYVYYEISHKDYPGRIGAQAPFLFTVEGEDRRRLSLLTDVEEIKQSGF